MKTQNKTEAGKGSVTWQISAASSCVKHWASSSFDTAQSPCLQAALLLTGGKVLFKFAFGKVGYTSVILLSLFHKRSLLLANVSM